VAEATPATDANIKANPRNFVIFPPCLLLFAARTKYEDRATEQARGRYSGRGIDLRSGDRRAAGCNSRHRRQQERESKESRHFPSGVVTFCGENEVRGSRQRAVQQPLLRTRRRSPVRRPQRRMQLQRASSATT